MKEMILSMTYLSAAFLALFGLAEILFYKTSFKVEQTRKLVHFGTGLLTLLFPMYLVSHWQVLLLCGSFLGILVLSQKFDFLKSINSVERKTYGSILFPVIVCGCYLVSSVYNDLQLFYLPILILAVSDPLAALVGKKYPIGKYVFLGHTKTLVGSTAFFISSFLISILAFQLTPAIHSFNSLTMATLVALVACVAEGLSKNGYDNLTIPVAVMVALHAFKISNLC